MFVLIDCSSQSMEKIKIVQIVMRTAEESELSSNRSIQTDQNYFFIGFFFLDVRNQLGLH